MRYRDRPACKTLAKLISPPQKLWEPLITSCCAWDHIIICLLPQKTMRPLLWKGQEIPREAMRKFWGLLSFKLFWNLWVGGVALDAFKHVFLYFVQTFVCADAYCYSVVVSVNEASNDSVPSSPLSPDNLSFRAHSMKRKYSRRKRPDDTVAWWQIQWWGECFDLHAMMTSSTPLNHISCHSWPQLR